MSVFSLIKRGRAQAKAHSAKQSERTDAEAVKLPYKHVPTHAASDALATAPSSWKDDDRPKIKEQNRRRTAMAAGGTRPGGPRVGSSLAYVSYPSAHANPVVPLPKNYSYSSIPSSWRERMASTPETMEEADYFSHPKDRKGKGREILPSFAIGTGGTASPMLSSGRTSPLSSRAVPATVGVGVGMAVSRGSENSSGSEDEKEIGRQPMKNVSYNPEPRPPPSRDSSNTGERLHRLHPAHARRTSESRAHPVSDRHYPPPARSTYFSAPRPTSRRTHSIDSSTPSVPAFPGQIYGHGPSSATSSVTSIGMAISTAPTSAASTPPPSTVEDTGSSDSQPFRLPTVGIAPSTERRRRGSFREYLRTSSDTVRLPFNEPSQPQTPSTRGRRLSKSGPQQSDEHERSMSASRSRMTAVPLMNPTWAQAEAMVYEPNRPESKLQYRSDVLDPISNQKHARGKLSKDRRSSKDHTHNTQTSSKPSWPFFRRRNSITGT